MQFLIFKNTERWLKKRSNQASLPKISESRLKKQLINREKHVEFAKQLFTVWDDDNSGVLDLDEIAEPLIELGLSTDSLFVQKLIQSLGSSSRKEKQKIDNKE